MHDLCFLTPTTLRRRQNTGRVTWYIAETGIAMEIYIFLDVLL